MIDRVLLGERVRDGEVFVGCHWFIIYDCHSGRYLDFGMVLFWWGQVGDCEATIPALDMTVVGPALDWVGLGVVRWLWVAIGLLFMIATQADISTSGWSCFGGDRLVIV
ncbi:MAG TPA: hypothetical protein VLL52_02505 [Anaerolineae bacterium]|nr:hypothetical protein [Anaerolineae bacterium]